MAMHFVTYLVHGHLVPTAMFIAKNLALFTFVLAIEIACVGWRNCSLQTVLQFNGSVMDDLLSFIALRSHLAYFLGLPFILFASFLLDRAIRPWMAAYAVPTLHWWVQVPVAGFVIIILAQSFIFYWFHRWSHHNPILWSVHKYHHLASDMTILNGERSHPLEIALLRMFEITLLSALTSSDYAVPMAVVLCNKFRNAITHSNITSYWGWIGRYVLVSPMAHRIHHQRDFDGNSYNYGGLQLWDNLFGTARLDIDIPDRRMPVGLTEEYERGNATQHYLLIFWHFFSEIGKASAAGWRRLATLRRTAPAA